MKRACAVALAVLALAPSAASAQVPMANYWRAGAAEDARQWCQTHRYVAGIPVYVCGAYTRPSCAWAGVPYPVTVGTCGVKWYMYHRALEREKTCIGRALYRMTVNITTFKVDCYWRNV